MPAPKGPSVNVPEAILDTYVGKYEYVAVGTIVTIRRDGEKLFVKSGTAPEGSLVARSETRFASPWGAIIEFQLDEEGEVTGAIVEQGPFRIPLELK